MSKFVRVKVGYGWRMWRHLIAHIPKSYALHREHNKGTRREAVRYALWHAWWHIWSDWKNRHRWPEIQRRNELIEREEAAERLKEILIADRDFMGLLQLELGKALADNIDRAIMGGRSVIEQTLLTDEDVQRIIDWNNT